MMMKKIIIILMMMIVLGSFVTAKELFINQSNGACNDALTRLQNNASNPWCTFDELSKPLAGDIVWACEGTNGSYIFSQREHMSNIDVTDDILVAEYPGDEVNVSQYQYLTWTNESLTRGNYIWSSPLVVSENNFPKVWFGNLTRFFTWENYDHISECGLENCPRYYYGSWFNISENKIYIRFNESIMNPNNQDIRVGNHFSIIKVEHNGMTVGKYITFANLTFIGNNAQLYIKNQSNIIIEDCTFLGGRTPIRIDGDDLGNKNIIIRRNYFNAYKEDNWYGEDEKENSGGEESDSIFVNDFDGKVEIYNNTFFNGAGAISLITNSIFECNGSQIYNNTFIHNHASQIEIENYCYNYTIYNNKCYDASFACLSLSPADGRNSPNPCQVHHNEFIVDSTTHWSPAQPTLESYVIKLDNRSHNFGVTNWNISHNSMYALGRVLNQIDSTTETYSVNNTWIDNIIVSNTSFAIVGSGLAVHGTFYDYNLYFDYNAANLFGQWNNHTGGVWQVSLAVALASVDWDGTWDLNSIESNPEWLSIDPTSLNFLVPRSNSTVCGAASDGGDIGALSCALADTINPSITFNSPASQTYNDTRWINVNVTCADNINVNNISVYLDGVLDTTNATPVNNTPWIYNVTVMTFTNHTINFTCWDNATPTANLNSTETRWFNIENTGINQPPIITDIGLVCGLNCIGSWTTVDPELNITYNTTWYNFVSRQAMLIMDFNVNNATDLSGNNNNGVVTGATWNSTGGFDGSGAFMFDGKDDYIQIAHSTDFSTALHNGMTITAWIKPLDRGENNAGTIIDKTDGESSQNGFTFRVSGNSNTVFRINAGGTVQSATGSILPFNNWYFVSVVSTSLGNVTMYVNGNVSGTPADTKSLGNITSVSNPRIGNRAGATDRTFNGSIDDVRIYNYTLSQTQITNLYNNQAYIMNGSDIIVGEVVTFNVVSSDGNNYSTTNSTSLTYDPDIVNPSIVFNSPASQTYTEVSSIQLSVTCADNILVQNVSLYINDTLTLTNTTPVNNSAWLTTFTPGALTNYTMFFRCWDNSTDGNFNTTDTRWFNFNQVAPNVTFNSPASQTLNNTLTLTFNVTCSDNIFVQNISFYADGTLTTTNTSPVNNTPWVFAATFGSYGNHTVFFRCWDNSSISATTGTRWYNLVEVLPTLAEDSGRAISLFILGLITAIIFSIIIFQGGDVELIFRAIIFLMFLAGMLFMLFRVL